MPISTLAATVPHTAPVFRVLDQAVFPGAGNIIKNEALHAARVDPWRPIGDIPRAQLEIMVAAIRTYSMAWYVST
jgi:formamidopyrimidine-DNA glycosylase